MLTHAQTIGALRLIGADDYGTHDDRAPRPHS
jgi:hypothetical protein